MVSFAGHTSQDPDEKRQERLFSIFLAGVLIPVLGLLGVNAYSAITHSHPDALIFVAVDLISLACLSGLWLLHRVHSKLARNLFLLFLVAAPLALFEVHLLNRMLITLTIPVMMAAFLLTPESSFIYALVVSLAYAGVILRSYALGEWGDDNLIHVFNYPSVLSLFALTCVAWVVSHSLNRALAEARQRTAELRALNEELDQRVQERTLELARALEREHAMAVRNQTILESIGDGVLVVDSRGQVILSNPAANRLARRSLENTPLQEVLGEVQPEVLARLAEPGTGVGEDGLFHVQFEWNQRTVAANIAPVRLDLSGSTHLLGGHVMVLRDVTREAELDRMKTIFLGSVSHELRTPMTAIKGYVDLLSDLEGESLSKSGRQYLDIIDTNIKQLLSLANDLIDMSRIEVGELALYPEWIELEPVVKGAVDSVRPEFEKRNLSLDVEIEPELPSLYLDRHRITQVLLNLLTNAYKYTLEGGVTVKVSHNTHQVQVEVSDTGVGMTEEEQSHLFERFFRSSSEVVQRAGGSGLGLTIARSIVELHGGSISVHSEYGAGTTFTVNLPVTETPESA
ncbi:MAG: hypothetical protein Kow0063_30620 [Anaerolineae bacterium]